MELVAKEDYTLLTWNGCGFDFDILAEESGMHEQCKALAVAEAVEAAGRLNWTARSGNLNSWPCKKWLTVKEALAIPEPDTSWMSDPWHRSKFYEWTGYKPPIHSAAPPLIPWDPAEEKNL